MKTLLKIILALVVLVIFFKVGYIFSGSNKLDNYLPFFLTSDGWNRYEREMNSSDKPAEGTNPAAVFCHQAKGILEKVTTSQGESNDCVFPNGEKCDEWALYRGECSITDVSQTANYTDGEKRVSVVYRIINSTAIITSTDLNLSGVELASAVSASGTRFVSKDGKVEAWEHHGELTVSIESKQIFIGKEVASGITFNLEETYRGKSTNGMLVTLEFGTGANPENNIYRLTSSNGITQGEFNYERGWKNDENATVYVLDWKKTEAEQKVFVRKSNSNEIVELDKNRVEIKGDAGLKLLK